MVGYTSLVVAAQVLDWLLDSDPAIRWQFMCDLTDSPDEPTSAER
jgi:hypothetical protein